MFDPYHKWLGIRKDQRPPTHYQLLGISDDETDLDVIEEAALRQLAHVRTYQMGPNAKECTRILNELSQARTALLNPAKRKEYDAKLARKSADKRAQEMPRTEAAPAGEITATPPAAALAFANLDGDESAAASRQAARAKKAADVPSIAKEGVFLTRPMLYAIIGGGVGLVVLGVLGLGLVVAFGWWQLKPAQAPIVVQQGGNKEKDLNRQDANAPENMAFVKDKALPIKPADKALPPEDHGKVVPSPEDRKDRDKVVPPIDPIKPKDDGLDKPVLPKLPLDKSPIDWSKKVELVRINTVPGCVAAFLDMDSFLTMSGPGIKLRRYPDGTALGSFDGHSDRVRDVAVSRDGKRIASTDQGKNVFVWDVQGRTIVKKIAAKESINCVAFSPDGRLLAGGGMRDVYLWDVEGASEKSTYTGGRDAEWLKWIAFTPDGNQVVSGGQTFRVWNHRTNETTMQLGAMGGRMSFAVPRQGNFYYLATTYRRLFRKTATGLEHLKEAQQQLWNVAFTPDYERLVVGGPGLIALADPEIGELVNTLALAKQEWQPIMGPHARYLAASCRTSELSHLIEIRPH